MAQPTERPRNDTPKPGTTQPRQEQEKPPGDERDMTDTVKKKVERGELSDTEARKLFEDLGKQLDA